MKIKDCILSGRMKGVTLLSLNDKAVDESMQNVAFREGDEIGVLLEATSVGVVRRQVAGLLPSSRWHGFLGRSRKGRALFQVILHEDQFPAPVAATAVNDDIAKRGELFFRRAELDAFEERFFRDYEVKLRFLRE